MKRLVLPFGVWSVSLELDRDRSGPTIKAWVSSDSIKSSQSYGVPITGGTLYVSNQHCKSIVAALDALEPWFLDGYGQQAREILRTLREALS